MHLTLHEAEAVASLEGHDGEEAVFSQGGIGSVVEGHVFLSSGVGHDEGALPAEERLVQHLEGEAEAAVVHAHPHAVRQRRQPVHHLPLAVGDDALAEVVTPLRHEVDDSHHGVLRQQRLLVQMDDPVVVRQDVHLRLKAVLQGSRLEQRPAWSPVLRRDDHLADPAGLGQEKGRVRHHLEEEVLQVDIVAHLQVPLDVLAHELREEPASHHTEAEERAEEG